MKPHKHAELIKAWADGAEIEVYSSICEEWIGYVEGETPSWIEDYRYRIKPEPKPDVVRYVTYEWNAITERTNGGVLDQKQQSFSNLKLTFDGETGKLKSAEVL